MADKILYTNKEELIDDESIPVKNKVTADDMNEIKETVNSHADDIETLETEKADRTEIPTDLSELSNENTKFVNETQLANAVNDEKVQRQDADNIINNTIATISVDYGKTIELSIDSSTFILTASLKNKNGTVLSSSDIDLPIESMIVDGRYNNVTKTIVLTLQNGNTITIPVADLISGLQSEITNENKLSSDLVDDTNHTNKFVTQSQKEQIETNKNDITNLSTDKEDKSNKVTELTSESTDIQYPSAKAVYDNESTLKEKLDRYKNTIETELGDSTDTGTDLTLNGTAEFDVGLEFSGNTSQTTYSGKNKFNNQYFINNKENFVNSYQGHFYALELGDEFKKQITVSMSVSGTSQSNLVLAFTDSIGSSPGGTSRVLGSNGTMTTRTFDFSNSEHVYIQIGATTQQIAYNTGIEAIMNNYNIQAEEGTEATDYEPYVGGQPAPNPGYPQTVHVVKGSNTIKIGNKNIISGNVSNTHHGVTTTLNNNILTTTGKATSNWWTGIEVQKHIPIGNLSASIQKALPFTLNTILTLEDGTTKNLSITKGTTSASSNITSPAVKYNINFASDETGATYNETVELQLELNSTVTNYVPHKEQTYPITLPEGMEMCKIGDYADEFLYQNSKWYKNEKIYKFLLTGNEDWRISNNVFYILSGFPNYLMLENVNKVFCNKYLGIEPVYTATYVTDNNVCCIAKNKSLKRVYITDSRFDNVEDFKSYLVEQYANGTPVIVYYILENPALQEITDTTLITQLNNIKQAYTYQGQTNITQTNEDLPFIIKADFKLSNLSRIEALESALETVSSRVDLLEE